MSLVAAECERRGISTVVLQLLREAAVAVRPPRALLVPFAHGFPLDRPGDPARQRAVLQSAFDMLEDPALGPPALVEYPGSGPG